MTVIRLLKVCIAAITLAAAVGCNHCDQPERVCCPSEHASIGSITGVVTLIGEPPPKELFIPAVAGIRGTVEEKLIVNPANNGIKNAVIRLMDVNDNSPIPKPAKPPSVSIRETAFKPHVMLVAPDSKLSFWNPDRQVHNIHPQTKNPVNYDSGTQSRTIPAGVDNWEYNQVLQAPDIIHITDDVRSWLSCFIVVHDPRYAAISDADGKFEIKNLRPGKYKMNLFHENFKGGTIEVEVKAGQAAFQDIKFGPRGR